MSNPIQIIDNVDAIQRVGSVIMQYEARTASSTLW